ncbi:uncharacterized transporter slc-17.2-like [Haliotis rufescens]|uniref:uncharacterized transporter slc-17.2-like n=1 Tax=Haliotis rufescens TaxID=6454 RepID=UPI00201EAB4A|nr:uncharacterized transporter slc-17.2-like [Haliotis rufescens]
MGLKETTPDAEQGPVDSTNQESFCEKYTSCRWVVGYLCCLVRLTQTTLRQCIGMAIVVMAMPTRGPDVTSSSPVVENNTLSDHVFSTSEFTWTSEFEGLILSAYTFGFLASPIIGGYVAGKYGGKIVITVSLVVGSIVTIATPVAARACPISMVVLRAVVGLFLVNSIYDFYISFLSSLGGVDPAIQSLWSKWAPKDEKASLTTCAYSGVSIGGILTFFISGYLGGVSLDNGWPLIFYVFGGFTLLCVFPWVVFVSDSPRDHPRITEKEMKLFTRDQTAGKMDRKMPRPPWSKMLTSPAVWAILIAHISYSWVTSWVMAYLPKYMKQILHYDIEEDGILSSAPFAGRLLVGLASGYVSDWVLSRRLLSTANIRKMFQLVGCVGCAACTIPIGFLDHENRTLAVILLILGLSLQNCTSVAFRINHLDIAPRFAGVMMGITVTCAMAVSLSAPLITSYVIKQGTRKEWQIIFSIVGGLNIVGAGVFVLFGKGTELDWAREVTTETHTTHDENNTPSNNNAMARRSPRNTVSDDKVPRTDDDVHQTDEDVHRTDEDGTRAEDDVTRTDNALYRTDDDVHRNDDDVSRIDDERTQTEDNVTRL